MAYNISTSMCSPQAIQYPAIPNATVQFLHAAMVTNVSQTISEFFYYNHPTVTITSANFCNVTLGYTYTGSNNTVNVEVFVPTDNWNERMQAIGGNGFTAGFTSTSENAMKAAAGQGYVAVTTDGGHHTSTPADWVLSNNTIDLAAIEAFAITSLNDAATIGKSLAASFFGQSPKYSYWTGCSQGGRQGLMLAQKFPTTYDGIVAASPAINWSKFSMSEFWPQLFMAQSNQFPRNCEINALTAAAISSCDGDDGVVDGVLTNSDSCSFDPFSMVGTSFNCSDTGLNMTISKAAAEVVNATWTGPRDVQQNFLWYGFEKGAALTGGNTVVDTTCSSNGTCTGAPNSLTGLWIQDLIEKDPNFPLGSITFEQFDQIFQESVQQFGKFFDTDNPDLSAFRNAGGKMLTYHGLMDEVIPTSGTRDYYDKVLATDPSADGYYRFFEAPMMGHCFGTSGGYPATIFDSMMAWRESGTIPSSLPVTYTTSEGNFNRILCPYPQKVQYDGKGNVSSAASFSCSG